MEIKEDKILAKYKKIANKVKLNTIIGNADEKRHDRISKREAKAMLRASKDGLTNAKIAYIFSRDPRAVSKALQRMEKENIPPELQLFEETAIITVEPTQRVSTSHLLPYTGMKYLDIPVSSNDIWIENIIITTSDPESSYEFLIFDRKQAQDVYNDWDIFWKEVVHIRRTKYITPKPQFYHDLDGCKHLHCAFEHGGHPIRFDLNNQELDEYYLQSVTFTVTLQYKLSS